MTRTLVGLCLTGALFGAACNDLPPPPEAGPSPTGISEPTTRVTTPPDCAEVASTEGAPAPVTMKDTFFEPFCLGMSSTQSILLSNAGDLRHNFTLADGAMDVDVEPGEETETEPVGDAIEAGSYEFFCSFHRDQGMVGTITIE
jgi:plastocyanin